MGYIGVTPEAGFTTGLLDRFTSTTGTTVTLTHEISSENDIIVFVNFVKQDSTNYSVGGSGNKTLTLGGTLVSSDVVEVHYLNIVNQTSAPSADSVGSSQITADVITGQTALAVAPDSTDELLISDAGSLKRIDVSLVGGKNTPAFYGELASDQVVSRATSTKLTGMTTNEIDTDSAFDGTTFTVPSDKAGKYYISAGLFSDFTGCGDDGEVIQLNIYKNGSSYKEEKYDSAANNQIKIFSVSFGILMDLSVGDTIEAYVYLRDASANTGMKANANHTFLCGFRLVT